MTLDRKVIITMEPNPKLSEILCDVLRIPHGFPYCVDKEIPLQELIDKGMVTDEDIKEMERGETICKHWRIEKGKG